MCLIHSIAARFRQDLHVNLEQSCKSCLTLTFVPEIVRGMMVVVNKDFLRDSYNRPIRDLRVSLTDRCNFRCFYCLPHGEPPIAPKEQMLSYEEIETVCRIFVGLGIEKIRLTGGEPMLRRDIETIISKLAKLKEGEHAGALSVESDKLKHIG